MDGVLCDSEPFLYESARRMFAEKYQTQVQQEDFLPFVGTGEERYLSGVAENYGIRLEMPGDKILTYEIYLEVIKAGLRPLPGVLEFVGHCRGWDLKLAVATSADRIKMEGNLEQIGLPPERFDACVTGSEIEKKKPDPQIFQVAAQELKCLSEECLIVEDAPVGITAAKVANSLCLGVTSSFSGTELRAAGADWTVPNLVDLPQTLLFLLGANPPAG